MPFIRWSRFAKTHAYITCQSATRSAVSQYGTVWSIEHRQYKWPLSGGEAPEEVCRTCLYAFQEDLKRRGHPHGAFPLLYPEGIRHRVNNGGYIRRGCRYVGGDSRYYVEVEVRVEPGVNTHLKQFFYPPLENFGFRGLSKQDAALQAIAKTEDAFVGGWPIRDGL